MIACSPTPAELQETQGGWQELLLLALVSRTEVPGGLRLEFHSESSDALRQLVEIERDGCPSITFELSGPVVTLTVAGNGESAVREMWA